MYISRIQAIDESVSRISLVDKPANGDNINACTMSFCKIDYEARTVTAAVIVPMQKLYRNKPERYVYFTEDAVVRLAHNFLESNSNSQLSIRHKHILAKGLYLVESYLIKEADEVYRKNTWLATFKVENDEIWNDILSGELNGFSLEGKFLEEVVLVIPDNEDELYAALEELPLDIAKEIFYEFKE